MCESNAYIIKDGQESLLMNSVETVRQEDKKLRLINMFGEEKLINASIKEIDLVKHKILIETE